MPPVQILLFLFFFLTISFVFSAKVLADKQLKVYDSNAETGRFVDSESSSDGEVEMVPPPPGSELLRTRKTRARTESFHKSADEMENLDTREVFVEPKLFQSSDHHEQRIDSNSTVVEEWEGFYMDFNSIYPSSSRSNSIDSDRIIRRSLSNSSSASDSDNRNKIFSSLSKSRSFKTNSTKSTPRLASFSEIDEDFELEDH